MPSAEDFRLALDAGVAAGTLALAGFTWWLAKGTAVRARESHASSKAADRLYEIQREQMERLELASQPNIRLLDVRQRPMQDAQTAKYQPLLVDLHNYGQRPARILKVSFLDESGKERIAEQRSRRIFHGGETFQVSIPEAFEIAIEKAILRAYGDRNLAPYSPLDPDADDADKFEIKLEIRYSEIDSDVELARLFNVDTTAYRGVWSRTEFIYRIVKSDSSEN